MIPSWVVGNQYNAWIKIHLDTIQKSEMPITLVDRGSSASTRIIRINTIRDSYIQSSVGHTAGAWR